MRLSLLLLGTVGALALAACGEATSEQPVTQSDSAAASDAPISAQSDRVIVDSSKGGEAPLNERDAAAAEIIPARFHGVWDYVGGTCAPESDMRMEITGSEILFYESIGTPTAAASDGDDIIVTLAMEGEGETWEQKTRFSLIGDGEAQQLASSDGDAPKVEDEYPSKRCPA